MFITSPRFNRSLRVACVNYLTPEPRQSQDHHFAILARPEHTIQWLNPYLSLLGTVIMRNPQPCWFSCNTTASFINVISAWGISTSQDTEMPVEANYISSLPTSFPPSITRTFLHINSDISLLYWASTLDSTAIGFIMDFNGSDDKDTSASVGLISP